VRRAFKRFVAPVADDTKIAGVVRGHPAFTPI